MKNDWESVWASRDRETLADDVESLAYLPAGGRSKQWKSGMGLACLPVIYGLYCLHKGDATLPWRNAIPMKYEAGQALAIAWIAVGAFLHFHYFWGLSDRLWKASQPLKVLALLVFLGAFFYAHYRAFAG
jgi:hypothetical protein